MQRYPLPKDLMHHEETHLHCRWCGVELNDKRKRFCGKEHRDLWMDEIFWPEDFQRQRARALKRDNDTCQHCGITGSEHWKKYSQWLHAHHKIRRIDGGSHHMDNLIILCRDCHIEVHRARGEEVEWATT